MLHFGTIGLLIFNSLKQKKLIINFVVNRNWKKLTDSRKRAKLLADNRKSYYPIETLVLTCFGRTDERRMARVESRKKITSGRESKKKAICQLRNGVHIFTVSVFDLLSSLTRS